jgi:hypothetical protein
MRSLFLNLALIASSAFAHLPEGAIPVRRTADTGYRAAIVRIPQEKPRPGMLVSRPVELLPAALKAQWMDSTDPGDDDVNGD